MIASWCAYRWMIIIPYPIIEWFWFDLVWWVFSSSSYFFMVYWGILQVSTANRIRIHCSWIHRNIESISHHSWVWLWPPNTSHPRWVDWILRYSHTSLWCWYWLVWSSQHSHTWQHIAYRFTLPMDVPMMDITNNIHILITLSRLFNAFSMHCLALNSLPWQKNIRCNCN